MEGKLNFHRWKKVLKFFLASTGLTAVQTKQCADKLLMTTTKSTATPATGLLEFQGNGFVSLCSPAGPYKEEDYWCEQMGFKIVRSWGCGQERVRSPVCSSA